METEGKLEREERKPDREETPEAKLERMKETAPFFRSKDTTAVIMQDVTFALMPAVLFGIFRFGFSAFLVLLLSVTSCVLTEHVCKRIRKRENGGYECSGVVTGLLMGMMLPPDIPYWIPVVGGVFAIGVVKMLFGGLGRNFFNPAAAAKCLFFVLAGTVLNLSVNRNEDVYKGMLVSGVFFGHGEGMIGEVSAFMLLLGGLYLVLRKVITLYVPIAYLVSFSAVLLLLGKHGLDFEWLGLHLCVGGVMLGAFFLTNDYSTTPMTRVGKVVFGVLVGALTGVLRILDFSMAAVVVAVLCGNLFTPLLDRLTLSGRCVKDRR